jgi:hypothetical protein
MIMLSADADDDAVAAEVSAAVLSGSTDADADADADVRPVESAVQTTTWVLMFRRADCDEAGSRIGSWCTWICVSEPIHPHAAAIRHLRRFVDLYYMIQHADPHVPRALCQWKLTRL